LGGERNLIWYSMKEKNTKYLRVSKKNVNRQPWKVGDLEFGGGGDPECTIGDRLLGLKERDFK
jgi:hypothetical protein